MTDTTGKAEQARAAYEARIAALVAAAPPLSTHQRARLAELLNPEAGR